MGSYETVPYDWQRTFWKAVKTGLVAMGVYVVADPSLMPAILQVIPAEYRMLAAVLLPAGITALRNWLKSLP